MGIGGGIWGDAGLMRPCRPDARPGARAPGGFLWGVVALAACPGDAQKVRELWLVILPPTGAQSHRLACVGSTDPCSLSCRCSDRSEGDRPLLDQTSPEAALPLLLRSCSFLLRGPSMLPGTGAPALGSLPADLARVQGRAYFAGWEGCWRPGKERVGCRGQALVTKGTSAAAVTN